jgi:hypothetical protein
MLGNDGFMAAAIIRFRASKSGFVELAEDDFARIPPGAGVPATAEVFAPGGAAPTMMPAGPFPA